jgi:hypothetical protein
MLEEARFFIPILTPSYFRNPACRDELDKLLRSEKGKGAPGSDPTDLLLGL